MREALLQAIDKLPKAVRLRAQNAMSGFSRAHALLPIDREMASFRAITAEEEAATALFRSLQLRKYPGADSLNLGNHRHKAALGPFLDAVKVTLAHGRTLNLRMTLDFSKPSLEISIPLSEVGVQFEGSENLQLTLAEPLGILGQNGEGKPSEFFNNALQLVAQSAEFRDIGKLIDSAKNDRNRLLYASDQSLPESQATAQSIDARQKRAEISLYLCIAVLQTRTHQNLAKQGLEAFLAIVGKSLDHSVDYAEAKPGVLIEIQDQGPSKVTFDEK